ncbi:unnamed protein product [Periconia digitata]|uniref:Uncharacterized protein n=1 Tax=Periconia digitata TaxID=1303443 RepID=A0A9W4U6K9_9PLEO|nr:unnamed protein product [Periconia digitata]
MRTSISDDDEKNARRCTDCRTLLLVPAKLGPNSVNVRSTQFTSASVSPLPFFTTPFFAFFSIVIGGPVHRKIWITGLGMNAAWRSRRAGAAFRGCSCIAGQLHTINRSKKFPIDETH